MKKSLLRGLLLCFVMWCGSVAIAELDKKYYQSIDVDKAFAHDDCLYFITGDYQALTVCGAEELSKLERKAGYLAFLIKNDGTDWYNEVQHQK